MPLEDREIEFGVCALGWDVLRRREWNIGIVLVRGLEVGGLVPLMGFRFFRRHLCRRTSDKSNWSTVV